MANYNIAIATREWQRNSLIEFLEGAEYVHRTVGRESWNRGKVYEEKRPVKYKVVRVPAYNGHIWEFRVTNGEAFEQWRNQCHYHATTWWKPGDRAVYAMDGPSFRAGDAVNVIDVYAGNVYVARPGEAIPMREGIGNGYDHYHMKFIGAWWLDREQV